jgi:L-fuculose-phosphate aldolase
MNQFLASNQVEECGLERKLRKLICEIGRQMYRRGLVVAREGNISARLNANRILITPAGACKGLMLTGDIVVTDLAGSVVSCAGNPSSEIQMHLLYYRSRPDVLAVCHAHPSTATGFAAAGRTLEETILPEIVSSFGKVPLAAYGTPGTPELAATLEFLVRKHNAILLANHGVVTCGQDLATAYQRMEMVEQFARILLTAELLGGPRRLPAIEVQKLAAIAARIPAPRTSKTLQPST